MVSIVFVLLSDWFFFTDLYFIFCLFSDGAGIHYPECDSCKVKMTKVFMTFVQHEEILDCEIGEGGTAFVCACPKCNALKMDWVSI